MRSRCASGDLGLQCQTAGLVLVFIFCHTPLCCTGSWLRCHLRLGYCYQVIKWNASPSLSRADCWAEFAKGKLQRHHRARLTVIWDSELCRFVEGEPLLSTGSPRETRTSATHNCFFFHFCFFPYCCFSSLFLFSYLVSLSMPSCPFFIFPFPCTTWTSLFPFLGEPERGEWEKLPARLRPVSRSADWRHLAALVESCSLRPK